jgi:YidC/Oxa1 family membrane protein insertase
MLKDENTRNTVLAIVLSLIVLLGWQYFVVNPRVEQERLRQQTIAAQTTQPNAPAPATGTATPGTTAPAAPAAAVPSGASRDQVLAATPRVRIDTARVEGSINLRGGRIDDVRFKDYHETVDRTSPTIVFFSPSGTQNPLYAEFGVVAPAGNTAPLPGPDTMWTQEGSGVLTPTSPVTLVWNNGQGLEFRRIYTIDANFLFRVREEVRNTGAAQVVLHGYALVSRHGTPRTLGMYILHEGMIGVFGEQGLREIVYSDLEKQGASTGRASGGWFGITDKYWAAAVIPDQRTQFQGRFIAFTNTPVRSYQADYLLDPQIVAPGASITFDHRLFAGAKEVKLIEGYSDSERILRFDLMIDWGWFYFFTRPLFYALDFFFLQFGNFGISILLVTVIIKLLFFPLANKSYESMSKMKKVQPEMTLIRERYADDKMKQQQLLMELYKKEKINPLSGCLPILIQIPVFFALYKVLFVTIEMRHAPFFGWIRDLSAHDPTSIFNLFGLIPFAVPEFFQVGVWPIIMGITMWVQMKMNPEPPDPTQKMIFAWMPLVFTFMLASFPAGLVIYWAWNNILSVSQQYYIMRKNGVKVELWDNLKSTFGIKKKEAA